jgi:hypothetical protein
MLKIWVVHIKSTDPTERIGKIKKRGGKKVRLEEKKQ